jgi:hypothetical protein
MIRRLLDVASTDLLLDPSISGLPPESRAVVLRDFAALRRHITFTMTLKLSFWNQLPWVLAGLAHKDISIARACARRALHVTAVVEDWSQEHSLTRVPHIPT